MRQDKKWRCWLAVSQKFRVFNFAKFIKLPANPPLRVQNSCWEKIQLIIIFSTLTLAQCLFMPGEVQLLRRISPLTEQTPHTFHLKLTTMFWTYSYLSVAIHLRILCYAGSPLCSPKEMQISRAWFFLALPIAHLPSLYSTKSRQLIKPTRKL